MSIQKKRKKEEFNYGTISDINGNNYRTIKINGGILGADQEWFADNLNVSSFKNGDSIDQAQSLSDWIEACNKGIPAWCYYEGKENFGKLYNLAAIIDSRGLAPEGYKIPDYIDFSILGFNAQDYEPIDNYVSRLDATGLSSSALKLMGKDNWKKKGTNICGINIIGSGWRNGGSSLNEGFVDFEKQCRFWLKPNGWYYTIEGHNSDTWIEFNIVKHFLKEFDSNNILIIETILRNGRLALSKIDYEKFDKAVFNIAYYQNRIKLITDYYPVKKSEGIQDIFFFGAISALLDFYNSQRRNGIRNATFSSGKNQIWFSSADLKSGAYVRPFKYL